MLAMEKMLPEVVKRRLGPVQRYGLRLTLFAVGLSLVGIPFALLIIEVMSKGSLDTWDKSVSERLFEFKVSTPWLTRLFNAISFLGAPYWFWFLIGATCIYLWRKNRKRLVAFLLTSTLGGSIINTAVKTFVDRPRPTFKDPDALTFQRGKSFPSGHSMSSTIAYGALLLIFLPLLQSKHRKWAYLGAISLVLAIGIARLGLGVHYVSDVLGGYILGLAWLILSTAAFEVWREDRGKPPVQPAKKGVEPEAKQDLKPSSTPG